MKKSVFILLSLLASGCGMSNEDIVREAKLCADNGLMAVQYIDFFNNPSHIMCKVVNSQNKKEQPCKQ